MLMGIINSTPDSFYSGGMYKGVDELLQMAEEMISEGADILDIGGQSTRPGSTRISEKEELDRVMPVIELLSEKFSDTILSIDTYYSTVARRAVEAGVSMVNDISAGEMDKEMIPVVASLRVPYICMHMKGTPDVMQDLAQYDDVVQEVLDFFIQKVEQCRAAGINDVIIDPGFGFGKTIAHNFRLLKELSVFRILNRPILAGLSRKSSIYKTLKSTAADALNGTTVLNTLALVNGASILRVHDIKEAREAVELMEAYKHS